MTGQAAKTNEIPEFLTVCILTPSNPSSYRHQNLLTQVSQDNNLPMIERTPRNQNSDANNFNNCPAEAIAGSANQQPPQAATMLKPVYTNTLIFDGKNEKFELFDVLFHIMLEMEPEMTEAVKFNHFHTHFGKQTLQTFRNKSASNKKTLEDVLIIIRRKHVRIKSYS